MVCIGRLRRSCHGFTIVELLVVLAIISILMSLLLTATMSARRQSYVVTCSNNLRQLGLFFYAYANENKDRIPGGTSTLSDYPNYATAQNDYVWLCGRPSAMLGPFLVNGWIKPRTATLLYCPAERSNERCLDVNRDGFDHLEPADGTTIRSSYATRPMRDTFWIHDPETHEVVYPLLPKLVKLHNWALLAESPQAMNGNHGWRGKQFINVLYADNSVRTCYESRYLAPWKSYVQLGVPAPGMNDWSNRYAIHTDSSIVTIWGQIDSN
ncbi:MAG: type II secretion system protein [Tepidisphaeraceae bacterium]